MLSLNAPQKLWAGLCMHTVNASGCIQEVKTMENQKTVNQDVVAVA